MTNAWNAALAYLNQADAAAASITAQNALVTTPASRLCGTTQNVVHVARKCRSSTNSDAYTIDLGSGQSVDTVAVMGLNLTAAGVTRARMSLTDPTATSSLLYDSGALTGQVDPKFGYFIALPTSPVAVRYVRVDVSDASLSYVEAGRIFVGLRTQVGINFAPGWGRGRVDRSKQTEGRGGQMFTDLDNSYRTLEMTFDWLSDAERTGLIEEIDRLNGNHGDILFITDPTSSNLGRDSIWGFQTEMPPVLQPTTASPAAFSRAMKIRERL